MSDKKDCLDSPPAYDKQQPPTVVITEQPEQPNHLQQHQRPFHDDDGDGDDEHGYNESNEYIESESLHPMIQQMDEQISFTQNEWNHSLGSCFESYESCLLGSFCSCLSFGRSSKLLRTRDSDPIAEPRALTTLCNPFSVVYYAANLATMNFGGPLLSMWRRGLIRKRYGIKGNYVQDVAVHICCHCCALIQEDREIMMREAERRKLFDQTADEEYSI